ncbi:MAG: sodium:calcium antiporter [Gammaproteobacteria bacterium]|nr:sodium:calcium antiporter [Gammaproteobacteria bacterium]
MPGLVAASDGRAAARTAGRRRGAAAGFSIRAGVTTASWPRRAADASVTRLCTRPRAGTLVACPGTRFPAGHRHASHSAAPGSRVNGAVPAFADLGDGLLVLVLVVAALVILVVGIRLSRVAEALARATGLGEAVVGGALLGASTSLSGAVVSVSAAGAGAVDLAASNAVGGIAAQTFFLAVADLCHRGANLEHAAASTENMANAALLALMLALVLLYPYLPDWQIAGVFVGTPLLFAVYIGGLRGVARIRTQPMWLPLRTRHTRLEPVAAVAGVAAGSRCRLLLEFVPLAAIMAVAGWLVAAAGVECAARLEARQSVVGALLTAVITSLPELVTTLAAVRIGALQLAVGGIIGGNTFDVLFLAFADVAYRDGSLYHAIAADVTFWIVLSLVMTAVLSYGLVRRERHGPANIGSESLAVLAIYLGALFLQLG